MALSIRGTRWWCVSMVGALSVLGCGSESVAASPCQREPDPRVVVDTRSHTLWMCRRRTADGTFRVRIGIGGRGKTREGDRKTPLGRYAIGSARPSSAFGAFIPIGYPTPEQRRLGYTGSAVGIHGPHRFLTWAGAMNAWFDTTAGCIGLSSDQAMDALARWVSAHRVAEVVIE